MNTRFPLTNVTQNTPRFSRYKTVEASMNKRLSNRWAAQVGGSYTMAHDFPGAYPNNPNGTFDEDTTRWDFKVSGTYEAPYGLRVVAARPSPGRRELRAPVRGRRGPAPRRPAAIFSGTVNVEPFDTRPSRQHHGGRRAG